MKQVFTLLGIYLVAQILWILPPFGEMSLDAWHLFSIFVALILGVLFRPLPLGATALIGLTVAIITKALPFDEAFSGFSNETVWLILTACFIARGFIVTGFGKRLSYKILSLFGKNSLGIGYGLVITDLILAPTIPSVTARVGGIVYPVLRSVVELFQKQYNAPRAGAFLTQVVFQGSVVTSAMFLTSIAGNPLIVALAKENGIEISWGLWFVAALVPGLCSLALIPCLLFFLSKPEIRKTPQTKDFADNGLKELGKIQKKEIGMIGIFLCLIVLWIVGPLFGIGTTTAALVGLSLLLLTKILDWKDLLSLGAPWDIFIWFSVLLTFSSALNRFGFADAVSQVIGGYVQDFSWLWGFGFLACLYFFLHYLFVSSIAQISALYSSFLLLAISLGTPPYLAALTLGFFSSLMASLTHYGSGQAPILFEMGTMSTLAWWKYGLVVSLCNLVIWLGIGSLWWKVLGLV